ncbi:MAG: hypothetical protein F6K19_40115 [Cyanothece sp. SIO1E1]|nr:hypothetical protein [Cyanothece sp. SIO1E1]
MEYYDSSLNSATPLNQLQPESPALAQVQQRAESRLAARQQRTQRRQNPKSASPGAPHE